MRYIKHFTLAAVMLVGAGCLAACGSLSHNIARDGSSAEQLVWPAPDDTTPMHDGGTWPTFVSLRQIQAGMSKNQIKTLIGPPHFSEGAWNVREWNYLFHLRDPKTGTARICQYKVLFDTDELARSFYWKPEGCGELLKPQDTSAPVVPVVPVVKQAPQARVMDVLFTFDKSGFNDIRAGDRVELHRLAKKLVDDKAAAATIVINGYAGRIGHDDYNQDLSQRRADTVRDYLISQGVAADVVTADGQGISDPITDCDKAHGARLVACLAPNRRVEIVITPQS